MTLSRQNIAVLTVSATVFAVGFAAVWNSTPTIIAVRPAPRTSPSAGPPTASRPSPPPVVEGAPLSASAPGGFTGSVASWQVGDVQRARITNPVRFGPTEGTLLVTMSGLKARLIDGQIRIWLPERGPDAPIWRGPAAEARFIHDVNAAVDTLKDRNGRIVWSNAAENGSPDLVIDRMDTGETRLLDKKRTLLWSGTLTRGRHHFISSRPLKDRASAIDLGGVQITRTSDTSTVKDHRDQVLWSGKLPPHPVILYRRGPEYDFTGRNGSASGIDRVGEVRVEVEKGQVLTEDAEGVIVGSRTVDFLKIMQTDEIAPLTYGSSVFRFPPRYIVPFPLSGDRKDYRFTYLDSSGRTIHQDGMVPSSLVAAPPQGADQPRG